MALGESTKAAGWGRLRWTLGGKEMHYEDELREGFRCQGPSDIRDKDKLPQPSSSA